jgi:CRISPR-associated protein Cmr3
MSRYLITLTPIDKFFFGGETTFLRSKIADKEKRKSELSKEERELREFDESFSSYVIKSNPFPQQTSLLGMLRFLFLSNSDYFSDGKIKPGTKTEVANLIGETSFKVDDLNFSEMNFGKIKRIYPCFIRRKTENSDWEDLIFAPFDYNLKVSFETGWSLLNTEKETIPVIDDYKSKDGLPHLYINELPDFHINEIEEPEKSGLFKEDVRIGIDRDFEGKTKTGAYYKQIFYRFVKDLKPDLKPDLKQDLKFAFYADLEGIPANDNLIVSLGGDNSRFRLTAKKVSDTSEITLPLEYIRNKNFNNCYAKIVLLSESFIEEKAMKDCIFSINETVSFRFLNSNIDTKHYYRFSGSNYLSRNDKKYNLYGRGSVFYFADEERLKKFESALQKDRFTQIGYNNHKSIKK